MGAAVFSPKPVRDTGGEDGRNKDGIAPIIAATITAAALISATLTVGLLFAMALIVKLGTLRAACV